MHIINNKPLRPAWIEIDLKQLKKNFLIINKDKPENLKILYVVKDQAYGHGAVELSKIAIKSGIVYVAAVTIDEALELRGHFVDIPIFLFGEQTDEQLKICIEKNITFCINDQLTLNKVLKLSRSKSNKIKVHVEIDTGMNRYGVRWNRAIDIIKAISLEQGLVLEGVMSHFAMSDELDKSFALLQLNRFTEVLQKMELLGIHVKYRHICNTGGFLDLPMAHFDMVRLGILPLGIYPSRVCRRIPGLKAVMSVKAKIAAIRELEIGDKVGYGMRYTAETPRRIAVIPLGYGDGFPRVRNKGHVLISGKRAPIIGGIAMDAMMVDITEILEAQLWDEVVLMGKQGNEEISVHEMAELKGSVSYDILTGWSWRLPRIHLDRI
jgi:alanine racemase